MGNMDELKKPLSVISHSFWKPIFVTQRKVNSEWVYEKQKFLTGRTCDELKQLGELLKQAAVIDMNKRMSE